MKVSRQQVAENRRKILDVASKLFREKGFEAVSVADIMAGAGLTHGGFYGYFSSKEALIAAALLEASPAAAAPQTLAELIPRYLSCSHKDNPGTGCAVAALAGDVARMTPPVRAAMTEVLAQHINQLTVLAEGDNPAHKRQNAIGIYAALIGGLTLARISNDETLSAEILQATEAFLSERCEP